VGAANEPLDVYEDQTTGHEFLVEINATDDPAEPLGLADRGQ
jgi:hypothetical protein